MCIVKKTRLTIEERNFAVRLREMVLNNSQIVSQKSNIEEFKNIITSPQPTVSPSMTLNEDEILMLVEQNDVETLKTLSVEELNYIGEILGIKPEILMEGH